LRLARWAQGRSSVQVSRYALVDVAIALARLPTLPCAGATPVCGCPPGISAPAFPFCLCCNRCRGVCCPEWPAIYLSSTLNLSLSGDVLWMLLVCLYGRPVLFHHARRMTPTSLLLIASSLLPFSSGVRTGMLAQREPPLFSRSPSPTGLSLAPPSSCAILHIRPANVSLSSRWSVLSSSGRDPV